jgi:hypothetical protein
MTDATGPTVWGRLQHFFVSPAWNRWSTAANAIVFGVLNALLIRGFREIGTHVGVLIPATWYAVLTPAILLLFMVLRLPTAHRLWRRSTLSNAASCVLMLTFLISILPYATYQLEQRREGRWTPPLSANE